MATVWPLPAVDEGSLYADGRSEGPYPRGAIGVGVVVDTAVGVLDGTLVGMVVGTCVGVLVGVPVGVLDGTMVGAVVNTTVGVPVAVSVGGTGVLVAVSVGVLDGTMVGLGLRPLLSGRVATVSARLSPNTRTAWQRANPGGAAPQTLMCCGPCATCVGAACVGTGL